MDEDGFNNEMSYDLLLSTISQNVLIYLREIASTLHSPQIVGRVPNGLMRPLSQSSVGLEVNSLPAPLSYVLMFSSIADAGVIVEELQEHLTIVSRKWTEELDTMLPQVELTCVLPPQVQPNGWSSFAEREKVFTLLLKTSREAIAIASNHVATGGLRRATDTPDTRLDKILVMKGGGVRGLCYAGAVDVLEDFYKFNWFVGTSAGAIAAVLLGAGFSGKELLDVWRSKRFIDFFDAGPFSCVVNLITRGGLFPGSSFTNWIDELLAQKLNSSQRVQLKDLPSRVTVYACRREQSVLEFDSPGNDGSAAFAVRCSMSIPLVFIPMQDQGFKTFDGGLQYNYPLNKVLEIDNSADFISLYLGSDFYKPGKQRWLIAELLSIWTESHDPELVRKYYDRTVIIDADPVGPFEFWLSDIEKEFLISCGRAAAWKLVSDGGVEHVAAKEYRDQLRMDVILARQKRLRSIRRVTIIAVATGVLLAVSGLVVLWRIILLSFATSA